MAIIQTQCWVQKPVDGYYKDCLAIFGIEYQSWLWMIFISLIIGFISYFVYSKIRRIKFETKNYILKSLLIALIILIIFNILRLWLLSNIII